MTTSTPRSVTRILAIVMAACLLLLSTAPALAASNLPKTYEAMIAYVNSVIARGKVPYSRVMKYHSSTPTRGNDVAYIQYRLVALGFDVGIDTYYNDGYYYPIDGIYGASTRDAIMQFQKQVGLKADGICGKATYNALLRNNYYKPTSPYGNRSIMFSSRVMRTSKLLKYTPSRLMKNYDVMSVQMLLYANGCYTGAFDGVYGKATYEAVRKFQRTWTSKPDGMAGAHTFNKLIEDVPEAS